MSRLVQNSKPASPESTPALSSQADLSSLQMPKLSSLYKQELAQEQSYKKQMNNKPENIIISKADGHEISISIPKDYKGEWLEGSGISTKVSLDGKKHGVELQFTEAGNYMIGYQFKDQNEKLRHLSVGKVSIKNSSESPFES